MVVVERVTRIFVFRANVIISLSQHNDANCAENKQQNIASIFSDENLFIIMKKKTTIIVHQSSREAPVFFTRTHNENAAQNSKSEKKEKIRRRARISRVHNTQKKERKWKCIKSVRSLRGERRIEIVDDDKTMLFSFSTDDNACVGVLWKEENYLSVLHVRRKRACVIHSVY